MIASPPQSAWPLQASCGGSLHSSTPHGAPRGCADTSAFFMQYALGAQCLQVGDLLRAKAHMEEAHRLNAGSFDVLRSLGAIHRALGDHESAVRCYRSACARSPKGHEVHADLAVALLCLGTQVKAREPERAIACYQEALVHSPTADAHYHLGLAYAEMGRREEALMSYRSCLHFNPQRADAYHNMGVIYNQQADLAQAISCYQLALQLNPSCALTLNNLGMICVSTGRLEEGYGYLSRAITVAPNYAEAYVNLGWLFWDQGDIYQAIWAYERCIQLAPQLQSPPQSQLLVLNYVPDLAPRLVFDAHKAWAEKFCRDLGQPFDEWSNAKTSSRSLKIGYISPDLMHHSVSFFAQCLLQHADSNRFEVFIYSNTARSDEKTALLKSFVAEANWRPILGLAARDVAAQIRRDEIDLLVDLAGHMANNRLDVLALKPAPVQATYIGYNNTTGLGAIDYRLTDWVADPIDTEQSFSEELVRLPGAFLCYTPPQLPEVDATPATREGYVTFGSFSCLAKVNARVVALWVRVLQAVPHSRLLLKAKGFSSRSVQARLVAQFERQGIAPHRLQFVPLTPTTSDHLKTYNNMDIMLDTFPYSNTTTTCEALAMSVPVITLTGKTHGMRVSHTLLGSIGLLECVAHTQDEYVQKARALASDLPRLMALRQNLRQTFLSSQLCDGARFMRESYEPTLARLWGSYCSGRPPSRQLSEPSKPAPPVAPVTPGVAAVTSTPLAQNWSL